MIFKTAEEQTPVLPFMRMPKTEPTFTRYIVNVLVNNKETKGAVRIREQPDIFRSLWKDRA